jgi:hypothetical protein
MPPPPPPPAARAHVTHRHSCRCKCSQEHATNAHRVTSQASAAAVIQRDVKALLPMRIETALNSVIF